MLIDVLVTALCVMTLLFVIAGSFCQRFIEEKNILREDNIKLEQTNRFNEELINRQTRVCNMLADSKIDSDRIRKV